MQIVYSKYSRARKPEYQIATFIECDEDHKQVCKKALIPEARAHILRMLTNYKALCNVYGEDHVAKIELLDEDTVRFEYIEGETWGARIATAGYTHGKEVFFSELGTYYSFLKKEQRDDEGNEIKLTELTENGGVDVDLHPDNIIYTNHGPVITDYEWVFPSAPITFVFQRAMHNFYYNYHYSYLENIVAIEDIWNEFGITEEEKSIYTQLEREFSSAITQDTYMGKFQQKNRTLDELLSLKRQLKLRLLQYAHRFARE